ncbi:hypothetical protein GQ457_16G013240 [Hibiscus cannabinus]
MPLTKADMACPSKFFVRKSISSPLHRRPPTSLRGLYIHRCASSLEALVIGIRQCRKVAGGCWNGGLG